MQNMPNRVASIAMRIQLTIGHGSLLEGERVQTEAPIGRAGHLNQLANRETIAARLGLTG